MAALLDRQVLVDLPVPRAPLVHRQIHRVPPAAAEGQEADLAEAATPVVAPSDVEEW